MATSARLAFAALAAAALSGCAGVAIERNFAEVERFAREQTGSEVRWLRSTPEREAMRAEVDRLLAEPLAIEDAVRIALGYSPAFQTLLAEAAVVTRTPPARRASPTRCSTFERLFRSGAEGRELDIGVARHLVARHPVPAGTAGAGRVPSAADPAAGHRQLQPPAARARAGALAAEETASLIRARQNATSARGADPAPRP